MLDGIQRLISSTDPVIFKMPRSPLNVNSWRALILLLAFTAFVSLMLINAGAQGRRSQNTASSPNPRQNGRKSIASVRSVDTPDGSRVTITSDVPLNDYEAYWGGDRFFVIIPNAEITYQNVQTLQASLRGRGFQDVRIERKGNDLIFSFRMQPGLRARPEQKFNRLEIIFTAPPGVTLNPNENRNTRPNTGQGGGTTVGTELGNTSRNTSTTTSTNSSGTGGGTAGTRVNSGGTGGSTGGTTAGGGTAGTRTGRSRGRSGGYTGYGGGGDRGGGAPLNIPLPSDIQTAPTPPGTPPAAAAGASPLASPAATGEGAAQATASPATSLSPTPEQIARNEPPSPVTAPPATTSTDTNAPAPAATTGFAAAIKEYWLPLLIGLLVLGAIVLLMASRSRADRSEERETERLQTKKQETIKEKPASSTGAAIAGGVAGAAAVAAMAKESRAKTAPAKEPAKTEETKSIEPVAPAMGMERIGAEVKSLLDGKDYDEAVVGSSNPDTRQIISTELLAALASRNPERRLRARAAFVKHGFFDEATKKLRTSDMAAERISAARALGLTQDHAATQHLVVALEDDDPEVRRASVNALAELRDPSAIGPLNGLLEREKNRKVPHSLIRRAIEASATIDVPQAEAATPSTAAAQDASATSTEKKDKDDDDREVFEI
jgi:hypothetical protein